MKQLKELSFSKVLLLNLLMTVVLFVACHVLQRYILFDIEQTRVFVYESGKVAEQLFQAGGFADMIALWLQQFFLFSFAGPAIMAVVLLLVTLCMQGINSEVSGRENTLTESVLCWLPSSLLFIYTEEGIFFVSGHIAILLVAFGLWVYARLLCSANKIVRWLLTPLMILAFGYACSTHVWPMIFAMVAIAIAKKNYVDIVIAPLSAALMVGLARYYSLASNETLLFSPDVYSYRNGLETIMIYIWVAIVIVSIIAPLANLLKAQKVMNSKITAAAVLVVGFFLIKLVYGEKRSLPTIQRLTLQRNLDTGNYDEAFEFCLANIESPYMANNLFYIKSVEGNLLSSVETFGPHEAMALIMKTGTARFVRRHMMSLYYYLGYVYGAQCQAFEYNEPTDGMMVPVAVQILAKTNIIQGNYALANKYLSHLKHTLFYADWAEEYSKFLYNDKAVEADKELGPRRKALNIESVPEQETYIYDVIRLIANASPELPAAQYKEAMLKMGVYNYLKPAPAANPSAVAY